MKAVTDTRNSLRPKSTISSAMQNIAPAKFSTFFQNHLNMPEQDADELAEIFPTLNRGSQTAILGLKRDIFERNFGGVNSGIFSDGQQDLDSQAQLQNRPGQPEEGQTGANQPQAPIQQTTSKEPQFPAIDNFRGRTFKERTALQKDFYTANAPIYQDLQKKIYTLEANNRRNNLLKKLNSADSLPAGLARANVDSYGNLRVPAAANDDAQQYVKTLNESVAGIKDTYGSQVTNFDLSNYLSTLPNLKNSKSARSRIFGQLSAMNNINLLHSERVRDVFSHYGTANITEAQADQIARTLRTDEEAEYKRDYDLSYKWDQIEKAKATPHKGKVVAIDENDVISFIFKDKANLAKANGYRVYNE